MMWIRRGKIVVKKYKTKPIIKEAIKYNANSLSCANEIYQWSNKTIKRHSLHGLFIQTLEGRMRVNHGDYIIKGLSGEFYPCKPEIFEKTYEAVDE